MKKLYLRIFPILFFLLSGITAFAQEWNISTASFNALGTISATTTVEGLTIYAIVGAEVIVDANDKTLDGFVFTHRLKLGGTGAFDAEGNVAISRVVAFNVTGNTKITVMGMSSSSSADRTLVIAAGNKATEVGRFPALGTSLTKGEFNYIGGPTTIFLFSTSSGINLYYIKAEALITSIKPYDEQKLKIFPNPAGENVFINVKEPAEVGFYNSAGILIKHQLVSPSQNSINISDLNPGLYFVKMPGNGGKVQKLIVR